MFRVLGPGFIGMLFLLLWIYCVFDVIATDSVLMRNLPKITWLIVVIFVPTVGSVAWLALGRPMYAGWMPGDTSTRQPPSAPKRRAAPRGLEDSDAWRRGELADREAEVERREHELRRREMELRRDEDPPDPAR